ncbi:Glucan endo-1,3-beta-glucosidase 1 [Senna tora]|uniref:Glucan endo-1,3-beta-glucosidase 1 n=1 Tax=Senna tora TaxID=362788 RepID=A0A834WW42_9FABA|nr:Glucan endo-1,3-beta-glucosidase 1 [Senna tora]
MEAQAMGQFEVDEPIPSCFLDENRYRYPLPPMVKARLEAHEVAINPVSVIRRGGSNSSEVEVSFLRFVLLFSSLLCASRAIRAYVPGRVFLVFPTMLAFEAYSFWNYVHCLDTLLTLSDVPDSAGQGILDGLDVANGVCIVEGYGFHGTVFKEGRNLYHVDFASVGFEFRYRVSTYVDMGRDPLCHPYALFIYFHLCNLFISRHYLRNIAFRQSRRLPSASEITHIRLYDVDLNLLKFLVGTNIRVILSIPKTSSSQSNPPPPPLPLGYAATSSPSTPPPSSPESLPSSAPLLLPTMDSSTTPSSPLNSTLKSRSQPVTPPPSSSTPSLPRKPSSTKSSLPSSSLCFNSSPRLNLH